MRTIALSDLRQMFATTANVVPLWLVTIDHAALGSPVRIINNNESITHGGLTYDPSNFMVTPGEDAERGRPEPRIVIENVSQQLVPLTRTVTDPPTIILEAISVEADKVTTRTLWGPYTTSMVGRQATSTRMVISLGDIDLLNRTSVKDRFTPELAPGLFS